MIPGGNQSPYREPCEGSISCFNGPRYQHARAREKNIAVFIYDTLLPNAYIPPRGDVNPYERFKDNSSGTCEVDHCDGGGPAPCEPWLGTDSLQFNLANPLPADSFYQPKMATGVILASGGANYATGDVLTLDGGTVSTYITFDGSFYEGNGQITVGNVSNTGAIETFSITAPGTYRTAPSSPNSPTGGHGTGASFNVTFSNQTENISPCFKFGFKNVQAMRQWHGTPGYFFNYNPALYTCNDSTYGTACDTTIYDQYSLSASQTKYCEASYSVGGTFFGGHDCLPEPGNTFTGIPFSDTYEADISVDPNSGVIMVNSASYGCGGAAQFAVFTTMGLQDWIDRFTEMLGHASTIFVNEGGDYFGPVAGPSSPFIISCSSDGYSFTGWPDGAEGVYPFQSGSGSWTFGSDSFSATRTYELLQSDDDGATFSGIQETESVSITDDSVTYTYNQQDATVSVWSTLYDVTVTVSLSNTNTATDVMEDIYTLLDEWDMTDDAVYPWRSDGFTSIAPMVTRNEVPENVSPLNFGAFTVTATNIDDCFGNDPSSPDYISTCAFTFSTDDNAALYDGSIIGAPLPAGYQQAFDWYYTDWQSCLDTDTGDTVGYIEGYGLHNTGQNGIPRTATHWTPNNLAWQFTGGAWVFYNLNTAWNTCAFAGGSTTFPAAAVVVAQKWAETKMGFPSENFARPAGDDKFAYDENHVYTIETIMGAGPGAQVKLELCQSCATPNGSSNPISDITGLWGGPSVGGFYALSAITGGNTVTLGALVYNVPSDWMSASDTGSGESAFTFGRLRWATGTPSTDAPPILGRANISNFAMSNGSNSVSELTTDSLPNLGMGISNADHVDVFDQTMSSLASNVAVTRIDVTHFTIPVGVTSLTNAAWLMSHGAPNFAWDDQFPKGDYVYNDFTYWPRLICEADRWNSLVATCDADTALAGNDCGCPSGMETVYCFPFFNPFEDEAGDFSHAFTQTAACLPFNPCSPSVLCISPNSETFATGHTYDFPVAGGIFLDEEYGSGWYAEFQQVIVDPLWQPPHFPASEIGNCNATNNEFQWTMDDGFCEEDSGGDPAIKYYSHAPLVEARLAVPSGAPALPNGVSLGWESPAGLTDCESVPADTLFPPNANGYGLSAPQPIWSLWSLECQCINAEGRFADEYQNEVVGCV